MDSLDVEIRELRSITRQNFVDMGNGYTSIAKYAVRRTETVGLTIIEIELVPLEKPYVRVWPCSQQDIERMSNLLNHGMSLGAFEGDRLVGVAIAGPRKWNNTLWVDTIQVDANYRNRGIGSQLCRRIESIARCNGFRIIGLEAQNTNAPAVAFYTKMGFILDGLDVSFYSNNESLGDEIAFFMKKRLS